jgi:hypothetical protein
MTEHNPYAAPAAEVGVTDAGQGIDALLLQLRGTKPWVRFLSVLGFIGTGLGVLAGLGLGAAGGLGAGLAMSESLMFGMIYVLMALLYFFPSLQLHRYAGAIEDALRTRASAAVATALQKQQTFWRTVGIMMLVLIVLWVLAVMGAIGAGVFAAFTAAGN